MWRACLLFLLIKDDVLINYDIINYDPSARVQAGIHSKTILCRKQQTGLTLNSSDPRPHWDCDGIILALSPGFTFRILSHSFGEKSEVKA